MGRNVKIIIVIMMLAWIPMICVGQIHGQKAINSSIAEPDKRSLTPTVPLVKDPHGMSCMGQNSDWKVISKNQISLAAYIPGLDLTGKNCSWWSEDTATHARIGGIFSKTMLQPHFSNSESWLNYYNFIPGQMACGVCQSDSGLTDTFMIQMDDLGACAGPINICRNGNNITIDFDNSQNQWTNIYTLYKEGIHANMPPFNVQSFHTTPINLPVQSFPAWVTIGRLCAGGYIDAETVVVY